MRIKVVQFGRVVGTLPQPKDPPRDLLRLTEKFPDLMDLPSIESVSEMTTIRTYDFTPLLFVIENGWAREFRLLADPTMGWGDLENVKGFRAL